MIPGVHREGSALPSRDWRRESRSIRAPRIARRTAWLCALCLLVACGGRSSGPPNLVLLIGDDQGYRDFGFMGSNVVRTPNLDALAREGAVLPMGYSTASLCRPALLTLLTGYDPLQYARFELRLREREGGPVPRETAMRSVATTLPRLLAERGYVSFQAGKYLEGHFAGAGFDQGMVEQAGSPGLRSAKRLVRKTLDPVLDFVSEHADQPFFLWFAPMVPHLPHDAPERFLDLYDDHPDLDWETRRYYASISWFDEAVGQLMQRLDEEGLRERTLVVYLVDNGWDPHRAQSLEQANLGGDRGKKSLYELGFRTPIVLSQPGTLEPARFEDALVSIADLFPTLLDYAGAAIPDGRPGRSLRPLIEGRAPWSREALIGHMHVIRNKPGDRITGGYFWRSSRWHYLQPELLPVELYDVEADPRETRNVAREHPDVVARAIRAIRRWDRELPSIEPATP